MLYLLWHCVAVHMGAVLWSTVLHAVLHSIQTLQPLQPQMVCIDDRRWKASYSPWDGVWQGIYKYTLIAKALIYII